MRALLFSLSLFAVLAVGCDDSTPSPVAEEAAVAGDADHNGLFAEVDKDALAAALAANDVTLIEFTATW